MTNAQPEPSMEEILASIRRIISEDEEEAAPVSEAEQSSGIEAVAPPEEPETVEIPRAITPEAPSADDAAGSHLITEDVEMIKKNTAEQFEDDAIVADATVEAAASAFHNLSQSVRVSDGPGRTLEDMVTEMLRPMVKEWLDANLPAIVEEKVEEEVQRVARRRR